MDKESSSDSDQQGQEKEDHSTQRDESVGFKSASERRHTTDRLRGFVVERQAGPYKHHDQDDDDTAADDAASTGIPGQVDARLDAFQRLTVDSGYQSSSAMSDGRASHRSVGSFGSQEDGVSGPKRVTRPTVLPQTGTDVRFSPNPTMPYAFSEGPKRDIATVCSNSVTDDMDLLVGDEHGGGVGGGGNLQQSSTGPSGTTLGTVSARFGEKPPARGRSSPLDDHTSAGGPKAAFSSTVPSVGGSSLRETGSGGPKTGEKLVSVSLSSSDHRPSLPGTNDMGPPLSRDLLLQRDAAVEGLERTMGGSSRGASGVTAVHFDTGSSSGPIHGSLPESVLNEHRSFHATTQEKDPSLLDTQRKPSGDDPGATNRGVGSAHALQQRFQSSSSASLPSRPPPASTGPSSSYTTAKTAGPDHSVGHADYGLHRYQEHHLNLPMRRFEEGTRRHDNDQQHFRASASSADQHDYYDPRIDPTLDRSRYWRPSRGGRDVSSSDRSRSLLPSRSRSRSRSPPREPHHRPQSRSQDEEQRYHEYQPRQRTFPDDYRNRRHNGGEGSDGGGDGGGGTDPSQSGFRR